MFAASMLGRLLAEAVDSELLARRSSDFKLCLRMAVDSLMV